MPDAAKKTEESLMLENLAFVRPSKDLNTEDWREWVNDQLSNGAAQFRVINTKLNDNTELTKQVGDSVQSIKDDTSSMVEMFQTMEGGFKFFNWFARGVARFAKPIGIIAAALAAVLSLKGFGSGGLK